MTRYLISFPSGVMDFPEEEGPEVARAAHAVVQEAKDAGAYLFAGGPAYGWSGSPIWTGNMSWTRAKVMSLWRSGGPGMKSSGTAPRRAQSWAILPSRWTMTHWCWPSASGS
jgi:hypothetical protein